MPLPSAIRADAEHRFGWSFAGTRVHTDSRAASSAAALAARAYTVGSHIVFADDEYRPESKEGRRLLAHELAHVVQAGHTRAEAAGSASTIAPALEVSQPDSAAEREAERAADIVTAPGGSARPVLSSATGRMVRRVCPQPPTNIAATPAAAACTPRGPSAVAGSLLYFCQDSVELLDGQESQLADLVTDAGLASSIEIHGYASTEGPTAYNQNLACLRAATIAGKFTSAGVTGPITLFTHGESTAYGAQQHNRNVVVTMTLRTCGPDATDWFIRQVAAAKTDPDVLGVKANLATAHALAALWGFSAEQLAIGGVAGKVREKEVAAGRPPRTPEAAAQFAAAAAGERELAAAERAAAVGGAIGAFGGSPIEAAKALDLGTALLAIRSAAVAWRDMVGPRCRYDFKVHTMRGPTSAHCPAGCPNTITLCPASRSNCYLTDVPGNLFYAHVGRFVGWTELVLQLGSEFAQLATTHSWDPPEDVKMISLGFALPDPLTRSAFCAALASSPSVFVLRPCANCSEPTSAMIR